jgi:hypothetical protein
MMAHPSWLPDLFQVNPWSEDTYDELYDLFQDDFVASKPLFEGLAVWFFPEIEDGKLKIFWHLTSRYDKESKGRLPDLRRSERLPWVRPFIEQTQRPEILFWDYEEGGGEVKTYIWLESCNFVVILKKYPDRRRRLITSFFIEFNNYQHKLRKKYKNRLP